MLAVTTSQCQLHHPITAYPYEVGGTDDTGDNTVGATLVIDSNGNIVDAIPFQSYEDSQARNSQSDTDYHIVPTGDGALCFVVRPYGLTQSNCTVRVSNRDRRIVLITFPKGDRAHWRKVVNALCKGSHIVYHGKGKSFQQFRCRLSKHDSVVVKVEEITRNANGGSLAKGQASGTSTVVVLLHE